MKNIFYLILTIVFVSCGEKEKPDTQNNEPAKTTSATTEINSTSKNDSLKKIYGYYVGEFIAVKYNEESPYTYSNKITVSIDSLKGDMLYGHSVVAGNERPFKGKYEYKNKVYSAKVTEPGDDKYDGEFTFEIFPEQQLIKGIWNSFKSDILVTMREYDLKKRDFAYNENNNIPPEKDFESLYEQNPKYPDKLEKISGDVSSINASNVLLRKSDVENLYKGDLEVIRNSIYARHGYSFKNRKMRYFFDNYIDWYMPVNTDIRNSLTDIEKKNIELLKRYEEHAENYYDEYGR